MKKNTIQEYAQALWEVTAGQPAAAIPGITREFVQFLARSRALLKHEQIISAFLKLAKKQLGIVEISITSARALDKKTITAIERVFGSAVESTQELDPAILGGVVVRTADKIFDASFKTQLRQLKNYLVT